MSEPQHEATIRLFPHGDGSGYRSTVRLVFNPASGDPPRLEIGDVSATIYVDVSDWPEVALAVSRLLDFMEEAQRVGGAR